ncbi:ComE-like protein [Desulfocucumis palustris]|uniref:ComE-like protein n=1 Tax=Desulfocucumis palustris TaxID=1898651 RepID=A0A2L2XGI0_9FIRM|nr:ComEC/Rec2 family competence protein [Desulfocucumis palustris]GBF35240.1 ComE-like protein [Desulfocucumis palustris]
MRCTILKTKRFLLLLILAVLLAAAGCAAPGGPRGTQDTLSPSVPAEGLLKVHFIDVGQADCILAQLPGGENMLVDAGNNDDGEKVVSYLREAGVNKIDFLVGTHPHEDHIGGLDTVINNFEIGKVYLPRVNHNTKTYRDLLAAIKARGLKVTTAAAGVEMFSSAGVDAAMLAPVNTGYEELNDYSAVIKLTYKNVSFLLAGDAEETSEKEMLKAGFDVRADVLKVGHHGSRTSTSPAFLRAVAPRYAVISAGKDNDYGHPHQETLQRLEKANVKVFRTDRDGTLIFSTNGDKIATGDGSSLSQFSFLSTRRIILGKTGFIREWPPNHLNC